MEEDKLPVAKPGNKSTNQNPTKQSTASASDKAKGPTANSTSKDKKPN